LEFASSLEIMFLRELESRGLVLGADFCKEFPMRHGHIIDFAFPDHKIAIEIDGPHHLQKKRRQKDHIKDSVLKKHGWTVIRFNTQQVESNISECVDIVLDNIWFEEFADECN